MSGEAEVRAGPCENCDRPDDELVAVHRVYVEPESAGPENVQRENVQPDVEWWCFSCRSMYPHQVV